MTLSDSTALDVSPELDMLEVAPPLAPLAMPKQILVRARHPIWRWPGIGAVLSLLSRNLGRAG